MSETKFCKFCGERIPYDAVICTKCGRQVEKIEQSTGGVVINNVSNASSASSSSASAAGTARPTVIVSGRYKNKWVAFLLCLLLGYVGGHKFYEGKIIMGIVYFFTLGFCGIGILIDLIVLLFKPNPYTP